MVKLTKLEASIGLEISELAEFRQKMASIEMQVFGTGAVRQLLEDFPFLSDLKQVIMLLVLLEIVTDYFLFLDKALLGYSLHK